MYIGRGFNRSELGDVDVVAAADGTFHLFHLVLPNHDYVAHAVSKDGLTWRRVKNAVYIGEPGAWDDDMIWTMHVSRDPDRPGAWRMFYTGLSRREGGAVQRIGLARSDDLYAWTKAEGGSYPLAVGGPAYESSRDEGRRWVSCRDPYFFADESGRYLLVDARAPAGPVCRRGCVGLARETAPDRFAWEAPLFYPRMYDDVEVPGLAKLGGEYYLVGNIREDIKVHYWRAASFRGPYEAMADNVLLPKGNYAARPLALGDRTLLWNFYIAGGAPGGGRILPPPVELRRREAGGELYVASYRGFDAKAGARLGPAELLPARPVLGNPTAGASPAADGGLTLSSFSGYEVFLLREPASDFRLRVELELSGPGKVGLALRCGEEADGYFVSLDLINGFAQARYWGASEKALGEESFVYHELQEGRFRAKPERRYAVEAVAWGGYLELSVDGAVALRLVDARPAAGGHVGFYVESAELRVRSLSVEPMAGPEEEDHGIF